MFSKLIISQNNKLAALFISKILKEEFDEILNDGDGNISLLAKHSSFRNNFVLCFHHSAYFSIFR